MSSTSFDLHDWSQRAVLEMHAAWRYRWHALVLAWCVAAIGAVLVFSLPDQYRSTAQVYADTSALTNPLLHGVAVQPDVRARLKIMTHTLLARPNLETVADKTGLSLRADTPAAKAALLDQLGASVKVRDAGARDLYQISYADTDPKMAQQVVQAFLQILMSQTLGANSASTVTAQHFLQQQVDDYGQRLSDAEAKLAAFKQSHVGLIPDGGGYSARVQGAQSRLAALQAQYDTAVDQRATIRGQMQSMASGTGAARVNPQVQAIDAQIAAAHKQLDQLLLRYTDAYPDVVATRRMLKQLQTRRANVQKQGVGTAVAAGVAASSPVYQGRQQSLYDTEVTIRTLDSQIAQQKQQLAALKSQRGQSIDVQATLEKLTRDYQTTKNQYNQLLARLNTAQLSQAATQSGNNLKFRVVSPPLAPLTPDAPMRGWLLVLVLAFALAVGVVFAWFLHKVRPVFTSLQSLRDFSQYPVVGAFHLIESRLRLARKRSAVAGFCAGVGLLVVALAIGFVYDQPLSHMVQHVFVMGAA